MAAAAEDQSDLVHQLLATIEEQKKIIEEHEICQKKLVTELQCPVCLETCTRPILMCPNGHILCKSCQSKLKECPTCRSPGASLIKNLFAENVSQILGGPCSNNFTGCKSFLLHTKKMVHMKSCMFRYCCDECDYSGDVSGLIYHIATKHKEMFTVGEEWEGELCVTRPGKQSVLFISSVKGFFRCFFEPKENGLAFSARYFGNKETAAKYKIAYKFVSEDEAFKCSYRFQCVSRDDGPISSPGLVNAENFAMLKQKAKNDVLVYCKIKVVE